MADYYPLISRAVAGLDKNSGENRRALYERARAALLAQLRGVTPALNESDITRERLALEESIRKVEAEAARQFVEPSRQQPPPAKVQPRAAEPRVAEPRTPEPRAPEPRMSESRAETRERRWGDQPDPDAPPRRYVNPPSPGAQDSRQDLRQQDLRQQDLRQQDLRQDARAESRQETRQDARQDSRQETRPESLRRPRSQPSQPAMPEARSDSIFDQPLPSEPAPAAQRHPLRRPSTERGGRALISESGLKDFRNVVSEANELGAASARAEKSARDAYAAVPAPAPDLDRPPPRDLDRPTARGFDRAADRSTSERPQYDRSEQPRMFEQPAAQERMYEPTVAPRPHQDFSEPMLEPSFALDDDRPPVPKSRRAPPLPSEEDAEYDDLEEVRPRRSYADLIKGLVAAIVIIILASLVIWQWPNVATLYRAFRAPSQPTEVVKNNSAAGPKKDDSRVMSGAQQEQPAQAGSGPGLAAVAQKVVLYEEDPADPNGKRFVGSAIWRTETVTPGPGQSPELAIRADVEVPERKLAMTWSLRRNTDKGLPASHTVEIMFKLPADFPSGGISNVPGILMKQAESTRGVPLAGLAVKVTNGFYLIGLSSADADKERNLQLLKERGWFDIPVVYNNNRRAILAMEKGTPGDRAFADAFKAWKQ